jgi:hypothetical protein
MGHFKGFFEAPSKSRKILRKTPLDVLPQTKKSISWTFKIRGTLVFFISLRERERVRESERKRKRKRKLSIKLLYMNR